MTNSEHAPTDMMRRRTPLPLCTRFLLFDTEVVINTNSESILRTAETAGFVSVADAYAIPRMKWEIVATPGTPSTAHWECNLTLGDHALYLTMGPEQWFAFDLETHDGAGFVLIADSELHQDTNAHRYLASIAYNVGASLRSELEKGCDD